MSDYTGPMETGAEESLRNQLVYCKEHRTLTSIRPDGMPKWCCDISALEAKLSKMKELVEDQAADEGLWFIARTAPEQYLQSALRKLHTAIEALAGGDDETTD